MNVGSWLLANERPLLIDALRHACPDLLARDADVVFDDDRPRTDDLSMRSTALLGTELLVKYAWSAAAAERIAREGAVMAALAELAPDLRVPEVVTTCNDPVFFVTRRVAGDWLVYPDASELAGDRLARTVEDLGTFLHGLHDPDLLVAVEERGIDLPAPEPQATTDALRSEFGAFVDPERQRRVEVWCDWVDDVLDAPADTVLLHGDFAGHNLMWDHSGAVNVFYDFEDVRRGDPAYDFRYLPAQAATLDILRGTINAYEARGGRPIDLHRVMAWHVRTALGDALWRSQAGVPLAFDGTPSEWVDELADRFSMAALG